VIDLERVATFLAVAKYGGFREAARHTGLSQPAVTQHVKRLEQSLKVPLINRSNAGSTLTAQGRSFLPYAERLLSICSRARAAFEKNSVVVGASSNTGIYLLQPHLKAFKEASRHAVEVSIGDNNRIAGKLKSFEIDVAVMEWWDHSPGFVAEVWRSEELVLIVPPGHPWAGRQSMPRDWLKGLSMLGGESGTGTGRLLRQFLGEDVSTVGTSMQLGSTEAVKHAVHAGLGVSLVMLAAVERELHSGWLHAVRIEGEPPRKEIYLIRRESEAHDGPALQFAQFLLGRARNGAGSHAREVSRQSDRLRSSHEPDRER
jgi:molybdate transport repressor ModE-like protein